MVFPSSGSSFLDFCHRLDRPKKAEEDEKQATARRTQTKTKAKTITNVGCWYVWYLLYYFFKEKQQLCDWDTPLQQLKLQNKVHCSSDNGAGAGLGLGN